MLARQRRLTEALGFLARSRFMLRKLREHWPNYRRLKIASEIHNIQKRKESICKLVGDQGLVEYHGKFYTFEQIRQLLQFEQERSAKWMALLKAQEEIRRARTERMVKDESKRQIPTANAVQVPTVAPTTKPSKSPKPRSDQDEQNRLNQLLK